MSEYEKTSGILTKIEVEDIEEFAKSKLKEFGVYQDELPRYYDTYLEWLLDDYGDKFVKLNNIIYKIDNFINIFDPEQDYCNLTKLDDGRILFDTMYYNGGCCWQEVVEDELENIKND